MIVKKKALSIFSLILTVATLFVSVTPAFADSVVGEDVTFNANGQGGNSTGTSDSNVSSSAGGNDSTTEATEAKNNRLSTNYIQNIIKEQGAGLTDWSMIEGDGYATFIEEMEMTLEEFQKLFDNANYTSGFDYNKIDTSDMQEFFPGNVKFGETNTNFSFLDGTTKGIFDKILNGSVGATGLQDGGSMQSNTSTNPLRGFENSGFNDISEIIKTFKLPEYDMGIFNGVSSAVLKEWLKQNGGYEIPGSSDWGLIDFPTYSERYEFLEAYLSNTSIKDTIKVQHIIEYRIEEVQKDITYTETPVAYPDGRMYVWSVDCISSSMGSEGQSYINIPGQGDSSFTYRFNAPGEYSVFAKQQLQPTTVDAVSYSMVEYWVVADTKQVIYKKISDGKVGNAERSSGRSEDKNVVYYNMEIGQIINDYDGTGISGARVFETIHNVTEEMLNGQFPPAGAFSNYSTKRIE